jgi:hypothetical protein
MAIPVKKGARLIRDGARGVAGADQQGSSIPVQQSDGAIANWPIGTFERDIVADLIETFDPRIPDDKKPVKTDPTGRPIIDPKEYGCETPDDFWDKARKNAGLAPVPKKA